MFLSHADVSPWLSAAQRPYVLLSLCSSVFRVSGCRVTLRHQPISTLASANFRILQPISVSQLVGIGIRVEQCCHGLEHPLAQIFGHHFALKRQLGALPAVLKQMHHLHTNMLEIATQQTKAVTHQWIGLGTHQHNAIPRSQATHYTRGTLYKIRHLHHTFIAHQT